MHTRGVFSVAGEPSQGKSALAPEAAMCERRATATGTTINALRLASATQSRLDNDASNALRGGDGTESGTEARMRKVVLIADLVAVIGAALWFGSYQRWMFYGFLACVIVIEISVRYLRDLY